MTSLSEIHILSLNCWGLKYLSTHRPARLSQIGSEIASQTPPPDIVGLQECWTQEDYLSIRSRTQHILPYGKFYFSGIFGGGLAILSRWPIEESSMLRYPLNGRPTAFYRGDWFVGKGVACARVRFGEGRRDVLEVFCTHLHAPYEKEPNDSYICHRTAQAWEIAKQMRHAAERGHLVVGLGDFNMIPSSLAHRLIEAHAPVRDVWRVVHPDSAVGSAESTAEKARGRKIPTADECLDLHGATCDSAYNTWRWSKQRQKRLAKGEDTPVDGAAKDVRAQRLDYVFFGGDEGEQVARWRVQKVKVGMTARHPELGCSLSDHFSVEATVVRDGTTTDADDVGAAERQDDLQSGDGRNGRRDMTNDGDEPDASAAMSGIGFLPLSTYDEILGMIEVYTARERRQRRLRMSHMGAQTAISVACLIGSWFSPRSFVCFILMLISTLGFGAGIVDGLMGGLFVGSELRALREFEWEIRNARSMVERREAAIGCEGGRGG